MNRRLQEAFDLLQELPQAAQQTAAEVILRNIDERRQAEEFGALEFEHGSARD